MKANEFPKAKTLFTNLFNLRLSDFMEKEMSVAMNEVHIDLVKFDDWLHSEHGNYEDNGLSMSDIIIKKYGLEAEKLITNLLLGK